MNAAVQTISDTRIFSKEPIPIWYSVIGWAIRLVIGAIFIYSGFTKAVDPWGTLYKLSDYAAALNINVSSNLMLTAVFALFSVEFIVGVFLVTGQFRRFTVIMLSAIMAVMLPLSLWLWISSPVADCGCFGDAWHISNAQTCIKNIIIAAGAAWLLIFNRRLHWLITPALQWIALIISAIYICLIGFIGYNVQPFIDFRPYPINEPLISINEGTEEPEITLIYRKDGVEKTFDISDELPDENAGWEYVRTDKKYSEPKVNSTSPRALRIWDETGTEDLSETAVTQYGPQLILFMPQLSNINVEDTWPVNSLYDWCGNNQVDMIAVVAADTAHIAEWRDISMAEYPIYTSEDTSIKEVVRGNPALVYLSDGNIQWKSSLRAVDVDEFIQHKNTDAMKLAPDYAWLLPVSSWSFILAMLLLTLLSFLPAIFKLWRQTFSTHCLPKSEHATEIHEPDTDR